MKTATLVFPLTDSRILLGRKKRGFGKGHWNGFGGKVQEESIEEASVRELEEECGLIANELEEVGVLEFRFLDDPDLDLEVHVFFCRDYAGTVTESEEMAPQWYSLSEIPYEHMWEDDKHWLPFALEGKKVFGTFEFENDRIVRIDLQIRS